MRKMRRYLFVLLFIPFAVNAQDSKKWEIGLNTAAVFGKMQYYQGTSRWKLHNYYFLVNYMSLSAYRNFERVQIGLKVDGGILDRQQWWISPHAVANYKIPFRLLYIYGGGVLGYAREKYPEDRYYKISGVTNGVMTGLQAGTVIFPGKRIGINLEAGVRFRTMFREGILFDPAQGIARREKRTFTDTYIPLSLGVRYRF